MPEAAAACSATRSSASGGGADAAGARRRPLARLDRGECRYCRSGRENLCPNARFTGCDVDGGFAEWAVADERFCFPIPGGYPACRRRRCSAPG